MARAVLLGTPASPGRGLGRALIVVTPSTQAPARAPAGSPRSDAPAEAERLRRAFEATAAELTELATRIAAESGREAADILEAQALIVLDPTLMESALADVASGVKAEVAVEAAAASLAGRLEGLDDPRFGARGADIRDVGHRVARQLTGRVGDDLWHADGTPAAIIAEDLAPSATATLQPGRVTGLALAAGTITGHAAIVARALGLPLVLRLGAAILGVTPDSTVIVDGSAGRVLVEPDAGEIPSTDPAHEGAG